MTYWRRMLAPNGRIHATPTAIRLAPMILRPPLPLVPTPVVDLLALPGLALLPQRLRDEFGIPWSGRHAALARTLDLAVRSWTTAVPVPLRSMPQARAAFRRAAATAESRR
jgi:uncharacterized protein (DUF2236 family)